MVSEEERERSSGWRGGSAVGDSVATVICIKRHTRAFRRLDRNPESGKQMKLDFEAETGAVRTREPDIR